MIANLNKKDIIAISYITLLSVISIGYGFSIIPSPAKQQVIAADQKRVEDLANIQTAVDYYYQTHDTLPTTLDDIKTQAYSPTTPLRRTDPTTGASYEYSVTSPYSYSFCATFETDSNKQQADPNDTTDYSYPVYKGDFTHPIGHYCFTEREQPNYNYSPSPSDYPVIIPCKPGRMCPMMPSDQAPYSPTPTPGVYNTNQTVEPTSYPTSKGIPVQ